MKCPAYVPTAVYEEAVRLRQSLPKEFRPIIDCLINRAEMEDTYASLKKIVDDNQMASYFSAACGAQNDFERYRVQKKEAKRLRAKVAKSADELASLLEKASELGGAPLELSSVRELLRVTVPTESGNHSTEALQWEAGSREAALAGNSHAWGKAPSLAECLRVVAKRAHGISAGLPINLAEAISSRKNNPDWEYVRNLWALLRDIGFEPSYPLAEAMVCTAIALDFKSSKGGLDASNVYRILIA